MNLTDKQRIATLEAQVESLIKDIKRSGTKVDRNVRAHCPRR